MNGLINPSTPTKNFGSFSLSSTLPVNRQTGKINWYKQTLLFAFLMICSTFIAPQQSYGQIVWPVFTLDGGDTIQYQWPPDTASYTKNLIIIQFRKEALILNNLCFDWMFEQNNDNKKVEKVLFSNTESIMSYLRNERFNIDELVVDSALRSYLHSIGGDTLRRITFANPCMDTLSLTRTGDTIVCQDYLWLALELKNDTSVIGAVIVLNYFYGDEITTATPNFYKEVLTTKTPNDLYFLPHQQKGMDMIGARRAWYFAEGSPETKVAVIDIGIDYRHCDLGKGWGKDFKIKDGWSFETNDLQFHLNSGHGTAVAGIVGAYTNFHECSPHNYSVAGVAGGWDGKNGNPGVSLYALKCVMETEHTISALRLAATNSLHSVYLLDSTRLHYGYGCHILNCSYAGRFWPDSPIDKAEWAAVNYAYENKALVVAGKGQHDRQDENIDPGPLYPAGLDPQKVLSVGASIAN